MAYAYMATANQVDAVNTQALFADPHNAIWCPPPNLIPWHVQVEPEDKDAIWLLWRDSSTAGAVLLGTGSLLIGPPARYGTNALWTDPDALGLRAVAEKLGYGGGYGMSFLRLRRVLLVNMAGEQYPQVHTHIQYNGLNQVNEYEEKDLKVLLNV